MINLDISRHREIFEPHYFNTPVHIIGAGATGSWLTLALAKLGIENITIWDDDHVEEHNVPNQCYSFADVGLSKVKALQAIIKAEVGSDIKTRNEKVTNQRLSGIVFNMVDTMEGRKEIWNNCIKLKPSIQLMIEPRMGTDMMRLYNVFPTDMNHIEKYEETFYNDNDAEVSACGVAQTIITTSMTITGWCGRQLINHYNNEALDNEILVDFVNNNIITERWDD